MRIILAIALLSIVFGGCKKDDVDQSAIDREIILKYIADNNLDAIEAEQGLFYVVDAPGTGDACTSSSTVKANYNGYLTSGNSFDSGVIDNFNLQSAIVGWQIGMPKFKEGGEGILLIPSAIGYGASGSSSIPANAVIIFDIELIKVY